MTGSMVLAMHDVAPSTLWASQTLLEHLETAGMKVALLVIAGPSNGPRADEHQPFCTWIRDAVGRGHEVTIGGWDHSRGIEGLGPLTSLGRCASGAARRQGIEEFLLVDDRAARRRLRLSLEVLHRIGLRPCGFMPSRWTPSAGAARAAGAVGLRYRTSHRMVHNIRTGAVIKATELSFGARPMTVSGSFAMMKRWAMFQMGTGSLLRIGLHPTDLARSQLNRSMQRIFVAAADQGMRVLTYGQLIDQ